MLFHIEVSWSKQIHPNNFPKVSKTPGKNYMPHAGNNTFKLYGPKDLLASLTAVRKILAGVQWMPPILSPSSDSRQVRFVMVHWSTYLPLFPVAMAEGCTITAGSSTLLWFRSGRVQPSGCRPTRISLEETLFQAGPFRGCLALCCTGTLLAQRLEGYGKQTNKQQQQQKHQQNPKQVQGTNSAGN